MMFDLDCISLVIEVQSGYIALDIPLSTSLPIPYPPFILSYFLLLFYFVFARCRSPTSQFT